MWWAGTPAEHSARHQRAVALVSESRLALMSTFATAIKATALLVALFTPGGAMFAFPAALRFVTQILDSARTSDGGQTGGA